MNHIIRVMTREEFREFKYFLNGRENIIRERADLKLIECIRNGLEDAIPHDNAFHQTRRRIKKQLELFIQIRNSKKFPVSEVYSCIEVGKYLFEKQLYKEALRYFSKAEILASQTYDSKLIHHVMDIKIEYILKNWMLTEPDTPVPEILFQKDKAMKNALQESEANAAYLLMLYQLHQELSKSVKGNIDLLLQRIMSRYQFRDDIDTSPQVYATVVNFVCRTLREKKDYTNLKLYAIGKFNILKNKKYIDKVTTEFLMDLIRSAYQACVRTRDYDKAALYMHEYKQRLQEFKKHKDKYIYYHFRSRIMEADLNLFTGKIQSAKVLLTKLEKRYSDENKSDLVYFLLRINLLAIRFCNHQIEECISTYSGLLQKYGKHVLKTEGLGMEMLLYTEICGPILYYEARDFDYALYLLKKIKRKYNASQPDEIVERIFVFIHILEHMIKDPEYLWNGPGVTECKRFLKSSIYIPGDKEFISLNAWLLSHMHNTTYYERFLKLTSA